MFSIDRTSYGFKLTFSGVILEPEMKEWAEASKKALATASGAFGVLVDMRELQPLAPPVAAVMESGQKLYKAAGMQRSAVILRSATLTMQFRRLAKQTGIDSFERYLNAADRADWNAAAEAWLVQGVDPDVRAMA